jgi:MFS family permease
MAPQRANGIVLAVLCAADFLVVLDGLIVAVALPEMQQALGIPPASLQWVINAYLLCFGGFLLLGGRLGDLYGRRRILLLGLVLFAAGALLAGSAWTALVLSAGRAVQGLGAALMAPSALALLSATFPAGPARTRALGWWSAVGSVGIPAGALLGGLLTASLGWRWVLLVNVPLAVLAAAGTRWAVPESFDDTGPKELDVRGAVLITGGIGLVIFAIVQTEHLAAGDRVIGRILLALGCGLLLLAAFVDVERRAAAPLLPPGFLRTGSLVSANVVGATLPVGLGAVLFLGTLYLQRVLGLTPLSTGVAYLALALPVIAASPTASWLTTRLGRRSVAVLGLLLQVAGLVLLAGVPPDGSFVADAMPGFVLVGMGAPIAFVPTTAAAMAISRDQSGLASGVFNTSQQVGNALALAALATAAAAWTAASLERGVADAAAMTEGYRVGFLLAAAIVLVGAMAALTLSGDARQTGRRAGTARGAGAR